MVYETIRANTTAEAGDWITIRGINTHLRQEFSTAEIDQAVEALEEANLIEVQDGECRPTDHDKRIPHPGER